MPFWIVRHESEKVYTRFELPSEPYLPVQTWAERLQEELGSDGLDILAGGGVECTMLSEVYGVEGLSEGVVIDTVLPGSEDPSLKVAGAISAICFTELLAQH